MLLVLFGCLLLHMINRKFFYKINDGSTINYYNGHNDNQNSEQKSAYKTSSNSNPKLTPAAGRSFNRVDKAALKGIAPLVYNDLF